MLGTLYQRCQYWGAALKLVRTTELEQRHHVFVVIRPIVVACLRFPLVGCAVRNMAHPINKRKQVKGGGANVNALQRLGVFLSHGDRDAAMNYAVGTIDNLQNHSVVTEARLAQLWQLVREAWLEPASSRP